MKTVSIGPVDVANDRPFVLIAGPCALETRQHAYDMCGCLLYTSDAADE